MALMEVSVQNLSTEVSRAKVLQQERNSALTLAKTKLMPFNLPPELLEARAEQIVAGALDATRRIQHGVRKLLLEGNGLDPVMLAGQHAFIMSLPETVPVGDLPVSRLDDENHKVVLRNVVEHTDSFGALASYRSQRLGLTTMLHRAGLFAPAGYESIITMSTEPGQSAAGSAMFIPEEFELSWRETTPLEAAA